MLNFFTSPPPNNDAESPNYLELTNIFNGFVYQKTFKISDIKKIKLSNLSLNDVLDALLEAKLRLLHPSSENNFLRYQEAEALLIDKLIDEKKVNTEEIFLSLATLKQCNTRAPMATDILLSLLDKLIGKEKISENIIQSQLEVAAKNAALIDDPNVLKSIAIQAEKLTIGNGKKIIDCVYQYAKSLDKTPQNINHYLREEYNLKLAFTFDELANIAEEIGAIYPVTYILWNNRKNNPGQEYRFDEVEPTNTNTPANEPPSSSIWQYQDRLMQLRDRLESYRPPTNSVLGKRVNSETKVYDSQRKKFASGYEPPCTEYSFNKNSLPKLGKRNTNEISLSERGQEKIPKNEHTPSEAKRHEASDNTPTYLKGLNYRNC